MLGYAPHEPLNREEYEKEVQRLAAREDLVPVREWPAGLTDDAPRFLAWLSQPLLTVAIRGDASSGFELLADVDANGQLDEPGIPPKKNGDSWEATLKVDPPAALTGNDRRAPSLVELK